MLSFVRPSFEVVRIDFTKKLSMMVKTPEGEKVIDYFIEIGNSVKAL